MPIEAIRDTLGPQALPWFAAAFLVLLGIACVEGLARSLLRPGSYDWRASAASFADALIRRGVDALGLSLVAPLFVLAWEHRLQTLEMSSPAAFVALFLGQDFLYYWYHRMAHRVRWFWASHTVHHSPNQLSLATALRLGWTGRLTGNGLFYVLLVWLGFPPLAVTAAVTLNLLYQFWVHAPWMPRLGPLEWVLNTPTHHKVHHASNPEYLDCNYGGVLIVFDRLFGTFVEYRPEIPIRYGLTRPLHSYNPLRIALHGWLELGRDLLRARGLRARLGVLVGPP
ncbi:sterol desaturase family protein [Azotobacter chroococcum]|uniref:Fatty acid hydroxylase n=1 Tax=Azotobacter chroococcum NCIMB 8003 TaxID=1328314 RepID=A0A0C4WPD5_9GAMM|nr:sterol desaturase family protein [Azotobacter chroococcum]AJE20007.1 Fatty acid hydroxylase [Azotobacter chroococcum NCIMB 8003]ASL25297.1 fatty acid hydroxylase [Azotobacter chroococcum]